jgi:hypothetical protein
MTVKFKATKIGETPMKRSSQRRFLPSVIQRLVFRKSIDISEERVSSILGIRVETHCLLHTDSANIWLYIVSRVGAAVRRHQLSRFHLNPVPKYTIQGV